MKILYVITIVFCFPVIVLSQAEPGNIATKKKLYELIVGEWQEVNVEVSAPKIKGFDETMQNPVIKNAMAMQAASVRLQFLPQNKLVKTRVNVRDTVRYTMSDTGFAYRNGKGANDLNNFKILTLTNDSLVYQQKRKSTDPVFAEQLKQMGAKASPDKFIVVNHYLVRIPEAKAPWSLFATSFPKDERIFRLLPNGHNMLAISQNIASSNTSAEDPGFNFFTSNDHGNTWKQSGKIKVAMSIHAPSFETYKGKLFMGNDSGASWSIDGSVWKSIKEIKPPADGFESTVFSGTDDGLYVAVGTNLYRTTDAVTWKELKSPCATGYYPQYLSSAGSTVAIAGLNTNDRTGFVYTSFDNGETWNKVQLEMEDYPGFMATALSAVSSSVFINSLYGLFVLKNESIKPVKQVRSYRMDDPMASLFTGLFGGDEMTIKEIGLNLFYGGANGVYMSADKGQNWTEVDNSQTRNGVYMVADGNDIIALTAEGKIFKASTESLIEYAKVARQ